MFSANDFFIFHSVLLNSGVKVIVTFLVVTGKIPQHTRKCQQAIFAED